MTQDSETIDWKKILKNIQRDGIIILICAALLIISMVNVAHVQDRVNACNSHWENELQNSGHYITLNNYEPTPFNLSAYEIKEADP